MTTSLADDMPRTLAQHRCGADRLKPEFPGRLHLQDPVPGVRGSGDAAPHPSGYRQFSAADVERLRYVLAAQRDQYLPLKVIKDQLDAIDRGLEPATPGGPAAALAGGRRRPSPRDFAATTEVRMTRAELLAESGLTATSLAELEQFGLIAAGPGRLLRRRRRARRRHRGRTAGRRPGAPPPAVVSHGRRPGGHADHPAGVRPGASAGPRRQGAGRAPRPPSWRPRFCACTPSW